MYKSNRGSYRKQESLIKEFSNSCLGRAIIGVAIMIVLAIVALITNPSAETMQAEMRDNIRQCIQENDSIQTDWIDDAVNNAGYIFTSADSVNTPEQLDLLDLFDRYNRLECYNHSLFSTMHIYNSFYIQGKRCGIGIFGIVIPTVNFSDFLLREGTMRKDYNQLIINTTIVPEDDGYLGENPDLGGVFEYNGD